LHGRVDFQGIRNSTSDLPSVRLWGEFRVLCIECFWLACKQ
jgi:hypothetical protein